MALTVTYTTFDGELVYENRSGVESFYVPDTQGSTAQLWNSSGVKTDEWTYWPFGEVRTRTGSTNTPLTFLGTIGYYLDILGSMTYVRARELRQALGRWQTVDPLWPTSSAYEYANGCPVAYTDPSGKWPWDKCPPFTYWLGIGCDAHDVLSCEASCARKGFIYEGCAKTPLSCVIHCICIVSILGLLPIDG